MEVRGLLARSGRVALTLDALVESCLELLLRGLVHLAEALYRVLWKIIETCVAAPQLDHEVAKVDATLCLLRHVDTPIMKGVIATEIGGLVNVVPRYTAAGARGLTPLRHVARQPCSRMGSDPHFRVSDRTSG